MKCDRLLPVEGNPCFHYVRDCEGQPGFCQLSDRFRCIVAIEHFAPRQSNSSIENWKRCKRYYYLSNIMGIRLREKFTPKPLILGTIMDKVMEKAWSDGVYVLKDALFIADNHIYSQFLEPHDKARLRALLVALDSMGFKPLRSECQKEVLVKIVGGHFILAKKDAVPDPSFFVEFKYTKAPDRYLEVFKIEDQAGMYFVSDPLLEFVVMAPIRNPETRTTKKEAEMSAEDYYQKTLSDILSRPSHYFPGWNGSKGRWGNIFYRSEFDLIEIEETARIVAEEIIDTAKKGEAHFYKNRTNCWQYNSECEMYTICKTNTIDEIRYRIDLDRKKATNWPGQEMLEQMRREDEKNQTHVDTIPQIIYTGEGEGLIDTAGKEESNLGIEKSGTDSEVRKDDNDLRGKRDGENYELFPESSEATAISPVGAAKS